jgi:hypothetical protein
MPLFSCVVFEKTAWYELIMPRRARIDAPGALHHIICRGIERRKFFREDFDRRGVLIQVGKYACTVATCSVLCYWANHELGSQHDGTDNEADKLLSPRLPASLPPVGKRWLLRSGFLCRPIGIAKQGTLYFPIAIRKPDS